MIFTEWPLPKAPNPHWLLNNRQLGIYSPLSFVRNLGGHSAFLSRLELDTTLDSHVGCVNRIAYNKQGNKLISGSDDLRLCIWSLYDHRLIARLHTQHSANIFGVRFMPNTNDEKLASGAMDSTVQLTNVEYAAATCHGKNQDSLIKGYHLYDIHEDRVKYIDVEPENPSLIFSASEDGTVKMIDIRSHVDTEATQVVVDLRSDEDSITNRIEIKSALLNPYSPAEIVVAGSDPIVRIFDRRMIGSNTPAYDYCPLHLRNVVTTIFPTFACFGNDGTKVLATYSGENTYVFGKGNRDPAKVINLLKAFPYYTNNSWNKVSKKYFDWAIKSFNSSRFYDAIFYTEQVLGIHPADRDALALKCLSLAKLILAGDEFEADCFELLNLTRSWIANLRESTNNNNHEEPKSHSLIWCIRLYDIIAKYGIFKYQYSGHSIRYMEDHDFEKAKHQLTETFCQLMVWHDHHKEQTSNGSSFEGFSVSGLLQVDLSHNLDELDYKFESLWQNLNNCERRYRHRRSRISQRTQFQDPVNDVTNSKTLRKLSEEYLEARSWLSFDDLNQDNFLITADLLYSQRFSGSYNIGTDIKEATFFGEKDQYVVSGSDDGLAYIWCADTGHILGTLNADDDVVNCCQAHPSQSMLATSGIESDVKLWSATAVNKNRRQDLKGSDMSSDDKDDDTPVELHDYMLRRLGIDDLIVNTNRRLRETRVSGLPASLEIPADILRNVMFQVRGERNPEDGSRDDIRTPNCRVS